MFPCHLSSNNFYDSNPWFIIFRLLVFFLLSDKIPLLCIMRPHRNGLIDHVFSLRRNISDSAIASSQGSLSNTCSKRDDLPRSSQDTGNKSIYEKEQKIQMLEKQLETLKEDGLQKVINSLQNTLTSEIQALLTTFLQSGNLHTQQIRNVESMLDHSMSSMKVFTKLPVHIYSSRHVNSSEAGLENIIQNNGTCLHKVLEACLPLG